MGVEAEVTQDEEVVEMELLLVLVELVVVLEEAESGWRLVPGVTTRRLVVCVRSPSRWTPSRHQAG